MDRLQKVIAASGITSRRKAEELIKEGRVSVDKVVITEMGYQPRKGALIEIDGKPIQRENKVYFVMNKPKKVLCTLNDEHDRKTVVDLMECNERVFPVGRLDYDTTGVLIMTNDGEFANEVIHPRYHIPKTYEVFVDGILETESIKTLERGVTLDDGSVTLPGKVWVTNKDFEKKTTTFELTIQEGKNHQVKRMCEAVGHEVKRLHRSKLGFLHVKDLKQGEYRILKPFEVKQLRSMANDGKKLV